MWRTGIYCAAKDGKAIIGTKPEIVHQIYSIGFDFDMRMVTATVNGYKTPVIQQYSTEYTNEELVKDAMKLLFRKLSDYGYDVFTQEQ